MSNPPQDETVTAPDFTRDALREWTHHVECVLRGLAHAMNNRAAALSAVIELSSDPDDDPAATRQILESEMDRMQELVRVVRGIGVPRDDLEAIVPADLAADATAIAMLHADLRDRAVVIRADGAPPVRARRWMLLRALVALAATRRVPPGERTVTVTLAGDGDWCVARGGEGEASSYTDQLARAMGGEPLADGSGFRLPTLDAVRRREAR